jgi:FtsP/CotA-like multicopper oxidase with cupredoxin domain
MGDGYLQYTFGFSNITGIKDDPGTIGDERIEAALLKAEQPAPTLWAREGEEVYLTLSNAGFMIRVDLFDPHSIHFHGFPNASNIFDGEPMSAVVPNQGSSLTYYYKLLEPEPGKPETGYAGTYIWHCHVEASEHMQMGMLGQLFILPKQDGTEVGGCASRKYVYNDGDGSTCYDVAYPLQILAFDPAFHDASFGVQPLPFALMDDKYIMLNGRGYPDTVKTIPINNSYDGNPSQPVSALITATKGQKVLLRLSSVSTISFFTVTTLGIPMKVVGKDAKLMRSGDGTDLSYTTNSVTLGGGETADVILDTSNVSPGRYFLYTTNMKYLNNNEEPFGGLMTEIVINP